MMNNVDTHELLAKLTVLTDIGCRPSIVLMREVIAAMKHQEEHIADLSNRIMQLRREVSRWEREGQRVE